MLTKTFKIFFFRKKEKKEHNNPDKPKKVAHRRIVVRISCKNVARRPGNKPGGYPETKNSPIIKCVPKGPAGALKLKPNNRRAKKGADSKPLQYQKALCT